ncbi:hypothetical protein FACS1894125_7120 [Actinomycetota bacterium]|nr:hypothetical protein FACS1894125_7120 [Actinomycetota bacterium]
MRKKVKIFILCLLTFLIVGWLISQTILYPRLTLNQVKEGVRQAGITTEDCNRFDDNYSKNGCGMETGSEGQLLTLSTREGGDYVHDFVLRTKTKHCYAWKYRNKELLFGYNWVVSGNLAEVEKIKAQIGGDIVHQDCIGNLACAMLTPSDCNDYL